MTAENDGEGALAGALIEALAEALAEADAGCHNDRSRSNNSCNRNDRRVARTRQRLSCSALLVRVHRRLSSGTTARILTIVLAGRIIRVGPIRLVRRGLKRFFLIERKARGGNLVLRDRVRNPLRRSRLRRKSGRKRSPWQRHTLRQTRRYGYFPPGMQSRTQSRCCLGYFPHRSP